MRTIRATVCTVLFAAAGALSNAASLVWDDPNPPSVVGSFRVWREEAAESWALVSTVTTNRWLIVLPAGSHRIAVSAVGAGAEALESALSPAKAVTVLIQPTIPRIEQ
jgi:hypothetical protein